MKLALHRSLTFWSGLLMIVFVCWAWRDSEHLWTKVMKGHSVLNHGWGGVVYSERPAGRAEPAFHYERYPTGNFQHSPEIFPAPFLLRARDLPKGESDKFSDRLIGISGGKAAAFTMREFMTMSVSGGSPGDWSLFIPHWLIALAVAVPWLGLLIWRAHRRKRHVQQES